MEKLKTQEFRYKCFNIAYYRTNLYWSGKKKDTKQQMSEADFHFWTKLTEAAVRMCFRNFGTFPAEQSWRTLLLITWKAEERTAIQRDFRSGCSCSILQRTIAFEYLK